MTETTETPAPQETEVTQSDTGQQDIPKPGPNWKVEARKWESRSKANHELVESLTAALDAAREELAAYKLADTKRRVAEEAGVTADVLRGDTEDEIREHATAVAEAAAAYREEYEPVAPVVPGQGRMPEKMQPNPELAAVAALFSGDPNNVYGNLQQ